MRIRFLLTIILVLNVTAFSAQAATVSGHTHYAGTTVPLAGVTVSIGGVTSTTGGNGEYTLHNVPSGWQTITGNKSSYDPYSESILVPEDGLTKDIEMTAQSPCTLSGTVSGGGTDVTNATVVPGTPLRYEVKVRNSSPVSRTVNCS